MQPINSKWTRGVDISRWQGTVDFSALAKSGVVFAISEAFYGLTQDSMFTRNYASALAAGLIRGPYQYGRPKVASAETHAQALVHLVNSIGGFDGFTGILDLEYGPDTDSLTPEQLTQFVLDWMNEYKLLTGMQGILYTSTAFLRDRLIASKLTDIPIFDAEYGSQTVPNVGSLNLKLWQYAAEKNSAANIPGIAPYNQVDEDVFLGTKDDLIQWLEELKGVNVKKTTVNVNGQEFAAVVVDNQDTYILWTELETIPGFSKNYVNGEWHFTVAGSAPNPNVQTGVAKIQEGLKLIQG